LLPLDKHRRCNLQQVHHKIKFNKMKKLRKLNFKGLRELSRDEMRNLMAGSGSSGCNSIPDDLACSGEYRCIEYEDDVAVCSNCCVA
jgi:natural product precursor